MNSKLTFLTSSRAKLVHAQHLAKRYGVQVVGKRTYGVAYREPRVRERATLLKESYDDALRRWRVIDPKDNGFFFIEDTSVIVHALSAHAEIPGVDVKYWMQSMNLERLTRELAECGGGRGVTVRSDVILHLPARFRREFGLDDTFVHFEGHQLGSVVTTERRVETNVLYPWLDDKSFNKWFVPDGCSLPMSALPIELADRYDFRRDSIGSMLAFLATKMNVRKVSVRPAKQLANLPSPMPLLILSGLPCAGKTTIGVRLRESCAYYHIEASDFMKRAFAERHGPDSSVSIEAFAAKALVDDPGIVARQVVQEIRSQRLQRVVITGFRSARESEIFRAEYAGLERVMSWFIEADSRIRFERNVRRARQDVLENLDAFLVREEVQLRMGLGELRDNLREATIVNEGSLSEYEDSCLRAFGLSSVSSERPVWSLARRPVSLADAIVVTLAMSHDEGVLSLSTSEMAKRMNRLFGAASSETSKNNISRFVNFRPSHLLSARQDGSTKRYALSSSGWSRAFLVARRG